MANWPSPALTCWSAPGRGSSKCFRHPVYEREAFNPGATSAGFFPAGHARPGMPGPCGTGGELAISPATYEDRDVRAER